MVRGKRTCLWSLVGFPQRPPGTPRLQQVVGEVQLEEVDLRGQQHERVPQETVGVALPELNVHLTAVILILVHRQVPPHIPTVV